MRATECHPDRKHHALGLCVSCWRRQNGSRQRARLRQYGLTEAAFTTMLEEQGRRCAICRTGIDAKNCHIDHDHATGVVRGLLCFGCNTGLGSFGDDETRLAAAIAYLKACRRRAMRRSA